MEAEIATYGVFFLFIYGEEYVLLFNSLYRYCDSAWKTSSMAWITKYYPNLIAS